MLTPQPLTGGETLRMGGAAMKFVPFCGAEFPTGKGARHDERIVIFDHRAAQ